MSKEAIESGKSMSEPVNTCGLIKAPPTLGFIIEFNKSCSLSPLVNLTAFAPPVILVTKNCFDQLLNVLLVYFLTFTWLLPSTPWSIFATFIISVVLPIAFKFPV